MSVLVPHLLLFGDANAAQAASLLHAAGYKVSNVDADAADQIGRKPDVDAIVVQLPALAAVAVVRRIESCRRDVKIVVVCSDHEAVRRALPSIRVIVIRPEEAEDDLVSAVDLVLVTQRMRRTG